MLTEILRFELGRHLRALSTGVYFLLFAALGFLWMTAAGGALPNASVSFGGGKVLINGPYSLFESISVMSYLGLLVISAIAGRAAYQDFDHQTQSFFFTSPISKRDALQDYAGEDAINRALHEYVQAVGYQDPPYTISPELISRLRAVMPPRYAYVIDDMLQSITLYENHAVSATAKKLPDGSYGVSLKVAARKVQAGELGDEKEVPLADWIDIGVMDEKGKPLYLERKKIDLKEMQFELNVKGVPATAGIDPWNKLVDRDPKDNTIKVAM